MKKTKKKKKMQPLLFYSTRETQFSHVITLRDAKFLLEVFYNEVFSGLDFLNEPRHV